MPEETGYEASKGPRDSREPEETNRAGDSASPGDRCALLDVRVNSPEREGLTGTTPANIYKPSAEREQHTIPPDGRPLHYQPTWRKDFPIDWPQDHYVARRDFTKFVVLTSFAFAVGQLWIGAQNLWRKSRGKPAIVKIASVEHLPAGSTQVFNYPGPHDSCILIHAEPGVFLAYSQKCTHLSCAVIPRPESGVIECPCHRGIFDLKTGGVIAGPPPRPLPKIVLKRRGDDIYATGVELRTV
jgi:Rieske Fe-S protein